LARPALRRLVSLFGNSDLKSMSDLPHIFNHLEMIG